MVNNYTLIFKLRVVDFYNSHKYDNIKQILEIFKISNGSLYNWVKNANNNELCEKKKYVKTPKFGIEIIDYVKNYVIKRINFKMPLLIKAIRLKFNKIISKTKIYNILKSENISYKKITTRNIHRNKRKYESDVKKQKSKMKKINMTNIISFDETHFDGYITKNHGWGIKGKRVIRKNYIKRNVQYSLICAISINKIVNYKIIKGTVNGEIFNDFMNDTIEKNSLDKKILLLDNARIHHTKILKSNINKTTNELLYNVPYTPELNPIELMFSKLKHYVKNKNNNHISKYLLKNIENGLSKIKKPYLESIYRHVYDLL